MFPFYSNFMLGYLMNVLQFVRYSSILKVAVVMHVLMYAVEDFCFALQLLLGGNPSELVLKNACHVMFFGSYYASYGIFNLKKEQHCTAHGNILKSENLH